jgi:hypothetical protein
MRATSPDLILFFDHHDPFTGLGKLHRRPLARRTAADYCDIVMLHAHSKNTILCTAPSER